MSLVIYYTCSDKQSTGYHSEGNTKEVETNEYSHTVDLTHSQLEQFNALERDEDGEIDLRQLFQFLPFPESSQSETKKISTVALANNYRLHKLE